MKKSRIFMASGAFLLAISAVFATKVNKKFGLSLRTGVNGKIVYQAAATDFFTASHGGNLKEAAVILCTVNGFVDPAASAVQLFTAPQGVKPLYLIP
jgi:hypothetical protein